MLDIKKMQAAAKKIAKEEKLYIARKEAKDKATETLTAARLEVNDIIREAEEQRSKAEAPEVVALEETTEAEEPEAMPQEEPETSKTYYILNQERHGIEIYFAAIPTPEVRSTLKAARFKWHNAKKCWYAVQSQKALDLAKKLTA